MPKFIVERDIPRAGRWTPEQLRRAHAAKGGFPANRISQVRAGLDPTAAEE